ncbi:MAG: SAM-dependent methyltransferase [Bacteroidales bacterium]
MLSSSSSRLFLLPSSLGEMDPSWVLPVIYPEIIQPLRVFFVEETRTARRFLRRAGFKVPFEDVCFLEINEHTIETNLEEFILNQGLSEEWLSKQDIGLLSEAGLPCVADPGAKVVEWAHRKKIKVVPVSGPSSIFLALMASGFNGQNFCFHGYLPVKPEERLRKIKELENASLQRNQTQIFIETPYRNQHLLESILSCCKRETMLCIAKNITLAQEDIRSLSIEEWRKNIPNLQKQNTVFLLMA